MISGIVALGGALLFVRLRTRPTLLSTLELRSSVFRFPSSSSWRRRKHRKKRSAANRARPANVPITIPAMAPPDNECECACGVGESDSEVATAAGAVTTDVMYFVVAAPLIVTTEGHTLVLPVVVSIVESDVEDGVYRIS